MDNLQDHFKIMYIALLHTCLLLAFA